ncbi:HEAT repeat domain-containing protein [Schlesneria paludicola]|uniref:HEAT repeat domain-containing protein n=1 Tax=Schlesneria paludicola TaxID=360056 RepID=UPI00029A25D1|nr:HEAT repeat domain-containing protein [Schlesneria paludicola]
MAKLPLPFSNQSVSEWTVQLQQSPAAEDRLRALQAISLLAQTDETNRIAHNALDDADSMVRAMAARLLGREGIETSNETQAKLVNLLGDDDPDVQFESARTLIRKKSSRAELAFPSLFARLDEAETPALMLAAVISTLTEADLDQQTIEREFRPRVTAWLEHDRGEVREAVASAFAKWPAMSVQCVDRLIPLLEDSEPVVREKIAIALGQSGIKSDLILAGLETARMDEDSEVARVASEALAKLKSE